MCDRVTKWRGSSRGEREGGKREREGEGEGVEGDIGKTYQVAVEAGEREREGERGRVEGVDTRQDKNKLEIVREGSVSQSVSSVSQSESVSQVQSGLVRFRSFFPCRTPEDGFFDEVVGFLGREIQPLGVASVTNETSW